MLDSKEKSRKYEEIGKVKLDLTWYPGEDLYSDGEIEDRLLDIAKNSTEEELNAVIAREKDWAILYHMSHIRENILDAVPIRENEDVLEIGSGCGAVTGSLARRAHSVTCVDLSRKRSMINAYRHRDRENINILLGNFRDVEANLEQKFDCITLIGVFEYALGYIGTDDPYGEFLRLAAKHLKKGGRLIIAIENRLGLKYWAGCREDHTGNLYEGLMDYPDQDYVHTFSKPELTDLFEANGFVKHTFFYPYPDYKLPTSVYSDQYLPKQGELSTNNWNFDRERDVLYDETKVFDSLLRSRLFDQFSNSYLVVLETEDHSMSENDWNVIYSRFSNDRSRNLSVRTDIEENGSGKRRVAKHACYPEGTAHVGRIAEWSRQLSEEFAGTMLTVNKGEFKNEVLYLEYLDNMQTLEEYCRKLCSGGREREAFALLRKLCDLVESKASAEMTVTKEYTDIFGENAAAAGEKSLPVTDLDMISANILIPAGAADETGIWTLIDYEWSYAFPIPVRFVLYRIWHYFIAVGGYSSRYADLMQEAGFAKEDLLRFGRMEKQWQKYIAGKHVPLREMYSEISPGRRFLAEIFDSRDEKIVRHYNSKLICWNDSDDKGEKSFSQDLVIDAEGHFEAVISLEELDHPENIRWDPMDMHGYYSQIRIERITAPAMVDMRSLNGWRTSEGWDEFWTFNPAYLLTGDFQDADEIRIAGSVLLYKVGQILPDADRTRKELGSAEEKIQEQNAQILALQNEIALMKGTKAWRAMEKIRTFRNFVMARVRGLRKPPANPVQAVDMRYQEWFKEHSATPHELEIQRKMTLPKQPKISILVPTWNTPISYLREMIDSVRMQTYGNWELCIADSSVNENGRNEELAAILAEYAAEDARIRYQLLEKNEGIAGNTNAAADLATGEYIALLDHDDLLAPDALFEAVQAICLHDPEVIYTDEDKIDMEGQFHFDPNLKPDYSPDLLRSHNYITHFLVITRELFERVGRLHSEYDGAQDYDLILRCTESTERIWHVPKILYYWRLHPGSTAQNPASKLYAYEAGRKAIEDHMHRIGLGGHVEMMDKWGLNHAKYDIPGDPLVSIVIPNKDHTDDLDLCIRSIMTKSTYRNFEIIVVENNSDQPQTEPYYERICKEFAQVKVVRWEREFNYSAINNFGVRHAKGEYLLLLNNDTEMLEPDSIAEMLGLCQRSDVGCVGAKLLFADDTVQHVGIILGPGKFAGHVFSGIKKDDYGFMMRALMTGNWSCVTAACMMVSRKAYDLVEGFSEEYAVALNDVDFCLKLRAKGLVNVMTPFSLWHHYESKSRGYEDTPEKKARFEKEVARFRSHWAEVVDAGDPYYNANLSVDRLPFSLW